MEDHDIPRHEIEVTAGPQSVAEARAAMAHIAAAYLDERRMEDVQLALTEVVTNAVRHGDLRPDRDAIRITVGTRKRSVRLMVDQPTAAEGLQIRGPQRTDDDELGGLGLRLVDHLADNWGHDPGPPGRVWFDVSKQG